MFDIYFNEEANYLSKIDLNQLPTDIRYFIASKGTHHKYKCFLQTEELYTYDEFHDLISNTFYMASKIYLYKKPNYSQLRLFRLDALGGDVRELKRTRKMNKYVILPGKKPSGNQQPLKTMTHMEPLYQVLQIHH